MVVQWSPAGELVHHYYLQIGSRAPKPERDSDGRTDDGLSIRNVSTNKVQDTFLARESAFENCSAEVLELR